MIQNRLATRLPALNTLKRIDLLIVQFGDCRVPPSRFAEDVNSQSQRRFARSRQNHAGIGGANARLA